MLISTSKLSEMSATYDVRYTGEARYFVFTMSVTLAERGGFYGMVVGMSGPYIEMEFMLA